MTMSAPVPVLRPKLPPARSLLPYLERIDSERFYSNRGPLSRELEQALGEYCEVDAARVVLASSGTSALVGALIGQAGMGDGTAKILTSAFGFVASASSIRLAGFEPEFLDIDRETWMLPLPQLPSPARRVQGLLYVAPYGRRPDWQGLAHWQSSEKRPVIIDAAASLDQLQPGELSRAPTTCFSLHATKALPAGEGGVVVAQNTETANHIRATLNHGFQGDRISRCPNLNGKPSEYTCAVGLATMAARHQAFAAWDSVHADYRAGAPALATGVRLHTAPGISRTYVLAEFDSSEACARAETALSARGIGNRRWYGRGIHREPAFASYASNALEQTEWLSDRLLGLPVSQDQGPDQTARVIEALKGVWQ